MFGEFFADDDVADRLTVADPQRFQRAGPGGAPGQFHVGEGLEQLLRTHAVQSLDGLVDRTARRRAGLSRPTPASDGAVGVQRPFGVANTVRAAVHLELPAAAVLERMQGQLHLAGSLLGQDDRLVEEDVLAPAPALPTAASAIAAYVAPGTTTVP